ncbi:MAG: hypothetical protein WCP83_06835 [Actinomycetota bacterium]
MAEHLVSTDQVAVSYIALRARVIDLLRSTPESSGNIVVPCTPAWTIRQLAAHLVGVPEDILAGRMEGVTSDAWTQAQVERFGLLSLSELADLFETTAPKIDAILHNIPQPIISQFVMDAVTHEQDMRSALGVPGGRDSKAVEVGVGFFLNLIEVSDPPLFDVLITTSASSWDVLRSLTGRRTVEQMNALGLDGAAIALRFPGSPFTLPQEAVE